MLYQPEVSQMRLICETLCGMIHDSPVFPCSHNLISSSCLGVERPAINKPDCDTKVQVIPLYTVSSDLYVGHNTNL